MNKIILLIAIIGLGFLNAKAQEELAPLEFNSNIRNVQATESFEKTGLIHNQYVYLYDTLTLPFIDDFTNNHFTSFDADPTNLNVEDSTWFILVDGGGTAFSLSTTFMVDTTFTFQYDTVTGFGFDSIVQISKVALPSQNIEVFNIDVYPVDNVSDEVWPTYNVHDSVWDVLAVEDTFYVSAANIQLFQDSSTMYFVNETAADTNTYWQDVNVYHNYTFATNIQTLGIASFDGLDANGYPYDFSSSTATGLADVMTAKPLDLSTVSPIDSVYFSFLYEAGGLGEQPENTDSLTVEFWSPLTQEWNSVWRATGTAATSFSMALIPITNPIYFFKGFQFRFKSYGSLTGSLDVWHVDYVELAALRSYTEDKTIDWAFSNPSPSFITDYTAMPWSHYEFDPHTPMKTEVTAKTFNSNATDVFLSPSSCNLDLFYENTNLGTIPYFVPSTNVSGLSFLDMDYTIPTSFWFDTIQADTCAVFDVQYTLGTNTITDLEDNDTLRHRQEFRNYYSFDDGTAEAAYGLVTNGAELAYKYYMPSGMTDTLRAISIHFSPTVNDVSGSTFFLQIWDDQGGEPGDIIYTTDDANVPTLYSPEYNLGNNGFYDYVLPNPIAIQGTYYIGWKQVSSDRLNIGFDKNINTQDRIFYKLTSSWSNTGFQGSLMMRPVFISDKDYLLSQKEITQPTFEVNIYPNPANNIVNIDSYEQDLEFYAVFDMQGKVVLSNSFMNNQSIDVSSLTNGFYILQLQSSEDQVIQKKITIFR